jgi:hypothetical protein
MASFNTKAFDEGWVVASVGDDEFVVVTLVYSDGRAFSYSSHALAHKLPEPFPTPLLFRTRPRRSATHF